MTHLQIFGLFTAGVNLFLCVFLSLPMLIRNVRDWRYQHQVLNYIWAYEKELRERGVTLPARCCHCCQLLPRHVGGCPMADVYAEWDFIMERLSRPIKYYPPGTKVG